MARLSFSVPVAIVFFGLFSLALQSARLAMPFRHLVAAQRGNGRVMWRDVFRFVGLEV